MQVKETLKNVQLDDKSSSVEARHQLDIGFELQFIGISLGLKLGQWCRMEPVLQEPFPAGLKKVKSVRGGLIQT